MDCSELRKFPEQMVLDLASEKECEKTSISPFVEPHGFRRWSVLRKRLRKAF